MIKDKFVQIVRLFIRNVFGIKNHTNAEILCKEESIEDLNGSQEDECEDSIEIIEEKKEDSNVSKEDEPEDFKDEYGVIYSKDKKRLLKCTNKSISEYTVLEGTEVICKDAFCYCNLDTIQLPDSLTTIEDEAFYGCDYLSFIELPNSITSIQCRTFEECKNLESIQLPDSITFIGLSAFLNCYSLSDIQLPDGISSMGAYVFHKCKSLRLIKLPKCVTSITNFDYYGNSVRYLSTSYLRTIHL